MKSGMVDEDSSATTAGRDLGQFVQWFVRVIEYTQKHRQVESGNAAQMHAERPKRETDVARRGAIQIGQH